MSWIDDLREALDPEGKLGEQMDAHAEQARCIGKWIRFTCLVCPTQAEGKLDDGRMFYFRARHGEWRLDVSHGPTDNVDDAVFAEMVAEGDDATDGWMEPVDVAAIVIEHLGRFIKESQR